MPVVPFTQPSGKPAPKPSRPPADEMFNLMALAQMHELGRLTPTEDTASGELDPNAG